MFKGKSLGFKASGFGFSGDSRECRGLDCCREEITRNLLHAVARGTLQSRKSER